MRRTATVLSFMGLVLMVTVVFLLSRTTAVSVEARIVLYITGLVLFIIGGAAARGHGAR